MTTYLTEKRIGNWGDWTEVWHVEPPDEHVPYRVIRDAWNDDLHGARHLRGRSLPLRECPAEAAMNETEKRMSIREPVGYCVVLLSTSECEAYDETPCVMEVIGPFADVADADRCFEEQPAWARPHKMILMSPISR
jgi:hypothetical protein